MRKLLIILIFSVTLRALTTILFGHWPTTDLQKTYFFLLNQTMFFFVLFSASVAVFKLNATKVFELVGPRKNSLSLFYGVAGAGLFVMFSLGEHALEVMLVASFDTNTAYNLWNFHEHTWKAEPFFSPSVAAYILASAVIGPTIEEFFLRGLMLRIFSEKYGFPIACIITSFIFTLMHYSRQYYLMAFSFSVVLCYIYALTRSLIVCAVFHGSYNLISYIHEYYFDIQWTRSLNQLKSPSNWTPQLVMLGVSIVFISYIWKQNRILLKNAKIAPFPAQIDEERADCTAMNGTNSP